MWQSPPFHNYGEPFIYSYRLKTSFIEIQSARGKLAVFPQIKNGELFEELHIKSSSFNNTSFNYMPTYYIDENTTELYGLYTPLFDGELLYVLGLEISSNRLYFDTPFLFATQSSLLPYSVLGLEESNVAYNGFSLNGVVIQKLIIVPNNSFVLSLAFDTSLSLRYEFGEEEIYKLGDFNLIVKKPISYTIIPSLPKVELPNKGILKLHFK